MEEIFGMCLLCNEHKGSNNTIHTILEFWKPSWQSIIWYWYCGIMHKTSGQNAKFDLFWNLYFGYKDRIHELRCFILRENDLKNIWDKDKNLVFIKREDK